MNNFLTAPTARRATDPARVPAPLDSTPRRRATDEALPADRLAADEFAVKPGSHQISIGATGHEHRPDERGVVKCAVCREAQAYEARTGHGCTAMTLTVSMTPEQHLQARRLASAAGITVGEKLRRLLLDDLAAREREAAASGPASRRSARG